MTPDNIQIILFISDGQAQATVETIKKKCKTAQITIAGDKKEWNRIKPTSGTLLLFSHEFADFSVTDLPENFRTIPRLLLSKEDSIDDSLSEKFYLQLPAEDLSPWILNRVFYNAGKLQEMEAKFYSIFNNSLDLIFILDAETQEILHANSSVERVLGYQVDDLMGRSFLDFVPPATDDERDEIEVHGGVLETTGLISHNGSLLPTESTWMFVEWEGHQRILVTFRDISERKKSLDLIKTQRLFYETLLKHIDSEIAVIDDQYKYIYVNRPLDDHSDPLLPYGKTDAELAKSMGWNESLVHNRIAHIQDALLNTKSSDFEEKIESPTGTRYYIRRYLPFFGKHTNEKKVISYGIDITERKFAEEKISYLAYHDALTGLANQFFFYERLREAMQLAEKEKHLVGIIYIDLDRFKTINETLGREVGDHLIRIFAERLLGCVDHDVLVSRLTGDEFVLLLKKLQYPSQAEVLAESIRAKFQEPFNINGSELFVGVSMGLAYYPRDSFEPADLIRKASIAMFKAKESGRNSIQIFFSNLLQVDRYKLEVENALRHAVERNEFQLVYQPQIDLHSGWITGCEALLRWQHPGLGSIPPSEFIPIAEEIGLISTVGEWVLYQACHQNLMWQQLGLPPITVSVNVSGLQIKQKKVQETVAQVLKFIRLDPRYLEIELTESSLMESAESTLKALTSLNAMGVRISIDDFGTGYSSLSYLKKFPIHALKIDKSFINDITHSPDDSAISKAILAMAHSLRLSVIAEGVETLEQLIYLKSLGCDSIQGYFISPPVSGDEFIEILKNRRSLSCYMK